MIELLTDSYPLRLPLVTSNQLRWKQVQELIKGIINPKPHDLTDALDRLCRSIQKLHDLKCESQTATTKELIEKAQEKNCSALRRAIEELFESNTALFCDSVLPFIVKNALELQRYSSWLPMLRTGVPGSIQIDRRMVLSILSNMFLCNNIDSLDQITPEQRKRITDFNWSSPDWYLIYSSDDIQAAVERIKCFLQYFISTAVECQSCSVSDTPVMFLPGAITVERCVGYIDGGSAAIARCKDTFIDSDVQVHIHSMSDPCLGASAIVDFANRELHFGYLTPSATQDELLFSFRPELFGAMFVVDVIGDEDVVVIGGAPQLCSGTGYNTSFRFSGPVADIHHVLTEQSPSLVYAMDAVIDDHFNPASVRRDANKAFVAFSHAKMHANREKLDDPVIVSSGSWGCGAFGGDKLHKFLQQIVAAKTAGIKLAYSAFGNEEYAHQLQMVFEKLILKQVRVCDLWDMLLRFKGFDNDSFHDYINSVLETSWSID